MSEIEFEDGSVLGIHGEPRPQVGMGQASAMFLAALSRAAEIRKAKNAGRRPERMSHEDVVQLSRGHDEVDVDAEVERLVQRAMEVK